ncbi:MAG: DEAD/DEAH box helicase family protein [Gammaproteobacteria bacterium]|nr:DEAD/DEAH box helicase [Rhodocyclaceae bacterium]MBU3908358.1 DEAD/DEAH box helicase family protein [Gammaproteobacteria bacterium]MBU3987867.1 DEAD/DEAH box helicase family protein [Gammaproteobacteria bacterium]MBU4004068.1 DEAD/DEAH box helicase family protein [Gammaproteobacteria bacterium]MBU4020315.1 DEAD/DEAH box helicase family protein [Gammaproteobacteria bacterium]
MVAKEAKARIKINKLLEEAGWRFFDAATGKANIVLEPKVKLTKLAVDALGENFEETGKGFIDFLLLDESGFPLVVLEAKSEDKNPLVGKEQARKYAKSQNCRFVILSNGNLHYFWDLVQGNPHIITRFPSPDSIKGCHRFQPNPQKLITERVGKDYIALTQMPGYAAEAGWNNPAERDTFIQKNRLRFLRDYQKRAIQAIQDAVAEGHSRFLFEMATGTGKTLTAAAVIKLFFRTGNARRVLFLVDRLELEDQANKAFIAQLKNDYTSVIYKERRDEWRKAEIVVTTVQSLLFNDKYRRLFSPTDFDLVISDEAHRSIGGNARAVFEYFVGYKLGLTATPRDYLKKFDTSKPGTRDPREAERRLLLDTYRTFGCESGQPTFRYSLLDGVREGYLINPVVVDARTDITTQLLSDKGYAVAIPVVAGDAEQESFFHKDFEKKFFSEATNRLFCQTFMNNALRDPISGELGKSIVFAVSQNHASKLTQVLNEQADALWPGKYQSDFAVQVTSLIPDAQQYTINFTNNNLLGSANFLETYKTSKARVCVTVGMMTTGYDCPDILNLGLLRPIFSPSDFVQIKGRGTRKHDFLEQLFDKPLKAEFLSAGKQEKTRYKLFDFFANCEYFEEKFSYDEVLKLPNPRAGAGEGVNAGGTTIGPAGEYIHGGGDAIAHLVEEPVGAQGMKVDRMFFEGFENAVKADPVLQQHVEFEQWNQAIDYVATRLLDKPTEFYTLDKLRRAAGVDRRLTLREILEKIFGLIPHFKGKDELLEDEFQKFLLDASTENIEKQAAAIGAMKYFFKAYATDGNLRDIIKQGRYTDLNVNPAFSMADFKAVPKEWREKIPEYVKDYVSLNQFM